MHVHLPYMLCALPFCGSLPSLVWEVARPSPCAHVFTLPLSRPWICTWTESSIVPLGITQRPSEHHLLGSWQNFVARRHGWAMVEVCRVWSKLFNAVLLLLQKREECWKTSPQFGQLKRLIQNNTHLSHRPGCLLYTNWPLRDSLTTRMIQSWPAGILQ